MTRVLFAVLVALLVPLPAAAERLRAVDADGLAYRTGGATDAAVRETLRANARAIFGSDAVPDLQLESERESLAGKHFRYVQRIDGMPVVGGDVVVSLDREGTSIRAIHSRAANRAPRPKAMLSAAAAAARLQELHPELAESRVIASSQVLLYVDGEARPARRIEAASDPNRPVAWYVDAENGALLRIEPLYFNDAPARVFEANPVTRLNDPALRDRDNTSTAVPSAAYSDVTLRGLAAGGRLAGPHVELVDDEPPSPGMADASQPLLFDRSQSGFEEVMAYYHIDASQRWMQSLGYTGSRQIISRALRVDAHGANGDDNSYYRPAAHGLGSIFFGDGGVDDAEDPDIILHEYGHAIQDAIAPGAFNGSWASEARAAGEGFGDYWAFSSGYADSAKSGRDPFCIGDWDARCGESVSAGCAYPPGSDCLRRVDGTKTMADYVRSEKNGVEHRNGEIWSSALREIFTRIVAGYGSVEGKIITDTLVLESHFGVPPLPTFGTLARKMLAANRILYGGSHVDAICGAMSSRGILGGNDCDVTPKGDVTLFQGVDRDRAIPDGFGSLVVTKDVADTRRIEDVYVTVDLRHPFRADLRIVLTSPDGTSLVMLDRSDDAGSDLHATFGLDVEPVQSLDALRGRPANGRWTLTVIDGAARDAGTLQSWGLIFRFEGDAALTARAAATGPTLHLLAAGHTPGAENTRFRTDVRIHNRGTVPAAATAFLTLSGNDGRAKFAAFNLRVDSGASVALDDVVDRDFRALGVGSIEFRGDVADLLITSRTYNETPDGTFGQFIPAVGRDAATSLTRSPLHIGQLQNTDGFRTNIGFAELSGNAGTVEVRIFDADGVVIESGSRGIEPFGHYQFPILGGRTGRFYDRVRAEVRVIEGAAEVGAYGSVVDNVSGDPVYVPAVRLDDGPRIVDIPAALHADGALGTQWRTDVWLANPSPVPISIGIEFSPAAGSAARTDSVTLPAQSVRAIDDIVLSRFGEGNLTGRLTLESTTPFLASSRTWTAGGEGSHGQFIGARPRAASIGVGAKATAIQIESSAAYRTNVGVAEVSGGPVTVRFTIRDAAGRVLATADRPIPARGQLQLNVRDLGAPEFTNGRVDVEVVSGEGRVHGYASVVDNRTGDPIYIPAQ